MWDLQNWRYSSSTSQTTTDANQGTSILTSGSRPRLITTLTMFNGSNTAAVNMRYFLLPLSTSSPNAAGQFPLSVLMFPLGFMNADSGTSADTVEENVTVVPMGAKGAGGNLGFIMPPNSNLIAAPSVNQNGSIVHKAISAEM